jgi:hypothetical protein
MTSTTDQASRRRAIGAGLGAAAIVFAAVLLLQWSAGAYRSEFGAHADEPAHVVTGMMVRDYIAGGLSKGASPMAFAKDYYERYPKVALGHYPPLFYVVEGTWMLPVRSPAALLVLMALLCTIAAMLTHWAARKHGLSPVLAWFPAALFIADPLVRTYTAIVMSDLLLVIFCLLATDAWRRFLGSAATRHALTFGVWAAAAILTKGSGLFLALLPPLSIALSGKWRLVSCRALWLAPLPVLVFALPWMVATRHITAEGMSETPALEYLAEAVGFFANHIPGEFGWLATLLLAGACGEAIVRAIRRCPVGDSSACLVAFVIGLLLLYLAVPSGLDARYFLPMIPALFILSIDTGVRVAPRLAKGVTQRAAQISAAAVIVLVISVETQRPVEKQLVGYAAAIDAIIAASDPPARDEFIDVLIAAGPHGEGAVTVAAVFRPDARLKIHRSTKALMDTDWLGREPKPLANPGDETWQLLRQLGVDWLLVDDLPDEPQVELVQHSVPPGTEASSHQITAKAGGSRQVQRIRIPRP